MLSKHSILTPPDRYFVDYSGNIKSTSNGGYVVPFTFGYPPLNSDYLYQVTRLLLLNSQLDTIAVKKYTDTSLYSERVYDGDVLPDGGFLIAGDRTSSYLPWGWQKGLLTRTDSQGDLIWSHDYLKETNKRAYMHSVQILDNNRALIGGTSEDYIQFNYRRFKPWFAIVDLSNGNIIRDTLWTSGYGFFGCIYSDANGGYYHWGKKDSLVNADPDDWASFPAYVTRLDTNFQVQWLTSFPYHVSTAHKEIWRGKQMQNGDYLVSGHAVYQGAVARGWVARINSSTGAVIWDKMFYSQMSQSGYLSDFVERPDGSIVLCGWTRNDTLPAWQGQNIWLLGLDANGDVLPHSTFAGSLGTKSLDFTLYPNPASGSVVIESPEAGEVLLYDISAKLLLRREVAQGKTVIDLPGSLPGGSYLLQLSGRESGLVSGKQLITSP